MHARSNAGPPHAHGSATEKQITAAPAELRIRRTWAAAVRHGGTGLRNMGTATSPSGCAGARGGPASSPPSLICNMGPRGAELLPSRPVGGHKCLPRDAANDRAYRHSGRRAFPSPPAWVRHPGYPLSENSPSCPIAPPDRRERHNLLVTTATFPPSGTGR